MDAPIDDEEGCSCPPQPGNPSMMSHITATAARRSRLLVAATDADTIGVDLCRASGGDTDTARADPSWWGNRGDITSPANRHVDPLRRAGRSQLAQPRGRYTTCGNVILDDPIEDFAPWVCGEPDASEPEATPRQK